MNSDLANPFNLGTGALVFLGVVLLYTSVLKGFALYRAGSRKDLGWFIAMFVLNTLGILELVYLLVISKKRAA